MAICSEDLSYETHIGRYRQYGHLKGDAKRDAYWHHKAQVTHMANVIDAVRDIHLDIVGSSQNLSMDQGYINLAFGAARRTRMIWDALRQLFAMILPERKEPMSSDDVIISGRALNDIYIHTLGTVDNYAWAILQYFGDEKLMRLHRNDIGLFKREFQRNSSISDFIEIAADFKDWYDEIKERRDPVAHRIPLSVPPAILNDDEEAAYRALQKDLSSAQAEFLSTIARNGSQDEVDAAAQVQQNIMDRMAKLGTFFPVIVHNPQDAGTPIYPTVPEDIGNLVLLCHRLNSRISERLS